LFNIEVSASEAARLIAELALWSDSNDVLVVLDDLDVLDVLDVLDAS